MKYLCLIYYEEKTLDAWSTDARDALWADDDAYILALQNRSALLGRDTLEPTSEAVTLRSRHGAVSITDGPFAPTKEQLSGLILIDASNLDEAIKLAARLPSARFGSIEVRPVKSDYRGASRVQ